MGDARRLVQMARKEAQENQMYYEEKAPVETVVKHVSGIKQLFTQYAGMRPFGVAFIIGGVDDTGIRLFETEPSGALAEYRAIAIGKGKKEAMALFEKGYKEGMPFEDALGLLANVIKKSLGEKEKFNVEGTDFAYIEKGSKFKKIDHQKIKAVLGKVNKNK